VLVFEKIPHWKKIEESDVAPVNVRGKANGQKIMVMKGIVSLINFWQCDSVTQPNWPTNKVSTHSICDPL